MDLGDLAGGGIVGLPPGMTNPTFIEPKAVPGFGEYMKGVGRRWPQAIAAPTS